jgi:hypothetical protein
LEIANQQPRLKDYRLQPPVCDRFERLPSDTSLSVSIAKANGGVIELALPFFWFDPGWHFASIERCRQVADAFSASGIVVSALHCDLCRQDSDERLTISRRMAPHRNDRAGWTYDDFENASIIDLRITPQRDEYGRFAYHPSQLERWQQSSTTEAADAGSFVNAMPFPPDWNCLDDMASKVVQLRRLSDAAIFVSFDALYFSTMIPAAIGAAVDGVIATTSADPLDVIMRSRSLLDEIRSSHQPALWIATDRRLTAEECVKCFALGASGLSIDAMCNDLFAKVHPSQISIGDWVDEVRGHANSCGVDHISKLSPGHLIPVVG